MEHFTALNRLKSSLVRFSSISPSIAHSHSTSLSKPWYQNCNITVLMQELIYKTLKFDLMYDVISHSTLRACSKMLRNHLIRAFSFLSRQIFIFEQETRVHPIGFTYVTDKKGIGRNTIIGSFTSCHPIPRFLYFDSGREHWVRERSLHWKSTEPVWSGSLVFEKWLMSNQCSWFCKPSLQFLICTDKFIICAHAFAIHSYSFANYSYAFEYCMGSYTNMPLFKPQLNLLGMNYSHRTKCTMFMCVSAIMHTF